MRKQRLRANGRLNFSEKRKAKIAETAGVNLTRPLIVGQACLRNANPHVSNAEILLTLGKIAHFT